MMMQRSSLGAGTFLDALNSYMARIGSIVGGSCMCATLTRGPATCIVGAQLTILNVTS